jgi:uncharacterized membrane protein YjgN (DUF898 family)
MLPDNSSGDPGDVPLLTMVIIQIIYGFVLVGYLAVGVYYQVRLRNYVWNTTTLGDNVLISTLSARSMIWIYTTNILAIVCTLGLAVPWAQIRTAKYRADNTLVVLADDWETYMSAQESEGTAIGDEIGEAFDVDIGIGL